MRMFDGRDYPEECVHWLSEGDRLETGAVGGGDILVRGADGVRVELPPCPGARGERAEHRGVSYYSDYIVETVAVHEPIGLMVSNWTVPKAPASRGPLPGMSSAYLFNGLEDGGGVRGKSSLILQPVLSYGKSGCVLNPLAGWHFTSFKVTDAGRAYCGKSISVREGDLLQGRMELVAKDQWMITSDAGRRGKSEYLITTPAVIDSAYLVLEGMIIYSCAAFPGAVTFTANSFADASGRAFKPKWRTEIRHTECSPQAKVDPSGDVEFSWNNADEMVVV